MTHGPYIKNIRKTCDKSQSLYSAKYRQESQAGPLAVFVILTGKVDGSSTNANA